MKVGDLVHIKNDLNDKYTIRGTAILIEKKGHQFWNILWKEQSIMMHEDYMEVISES